MKSNMLAIIKMYEMGCYFGAANPPLYLCWTMTSVNNAKDIMSSKDKAALVQHEVTLYKPFGNCAIIYVCSGSLLSHIKTLRDIARDRGISHYLYRRQKNDQYHLYRV